MIAIHSTPEGLWQVEVLTQPFATGPRLSVKARRPKPFALAYELFTRLTKMRDDHAAAITLARMNTYQIMCE